MHFSCDRTGFPLIGIPSLKLEVQLWPVTKLQFESYLSDTGREGNAYYEKLLEGNPRVSITRCTEKNREGLFITNILPEEVLEYAKWLGEDFRPLTFQEWRKIYEDWEKTSVSPEDIKSILNAITTDSAHLYLQYIEKNIENKNFQELSLMQKGIIEWVTEGKSPDVGLGAPNYKFRKYGSQITTGFRNKDITIRDKCFGFRFARMI